ncbi:MAG: hypothetical protein IPN01_22280 [Deltaproteobacteria bacterium]|nr:hypothetical protein [Deltaproteobacteria bacterium]
MLWWLPDPSSREGLRAQPGLFVLHPWLGAAEARRLAQAISALDGGRLPLLALPYAQLQRVDPALMLQTEAVLLIELPEGATIDPDLAPKAVVIVRGLRARPSPTQPLREALRLALSVALTQDAHPLRLVGAGPWLSRQLARRAAEPDELLDLLDRAVAHRAGLPEQDEEAWARSVEHAAGAHVAERLRRLPAEARWDTLRVLLGLAEPAAGLHEGARAGLLTLDGGAPRLTAVARGLAEGEARGGLLAGLVGEELPEDLREALTPPVTRAASMTPEPQPSGAQIGGGVGLGDAARAWVDAAEGLRDEEQALLIRGVEAIETAERWAGINDQGRLTTLGPTVLALREAGRGGVGDFGARAAALGELLVLAAAWLPEDEPRGARALAELRSMAQRGALPPAVWASALLRRASTLLSAPQAEDRRAEVATLLEEQASVAGGERARAEGLGLRGLLLQAQGQPDEALQAFQEAGRAFGALGLERDQAIHNGPDRRRAPGARTARRGPPHPQGGGATRLRATRRRRARASPGPDRHAADS